MGHTGFMRSIWKGSVAFGLVNVPVKVYSATEDHDIKFHQVHAKDNGRIRYKRVCEVCGEVVEYRDIVRAFESDDGQSVVITDEDIATLPEERSREIEVLEFVPAGQLFLVLGPLLALHFVLAAVALRWREGRS